MIRNRTSIRGFTLVELLVVIGIIAILIGILIPVVGKVKNSARVADTKNFISQLQGAIERYHQDFNAYPGPLSYAEIYQTDATKQAPIVAPATPATGFVAFTAAADLAKLTMSENLVLGLFGGLRVDASASPAKLVYDPSAVGLGPVSLLNLTVSGAAPKRYDPYLTNIKQLSWRDATGGKSGKYQDDAGSADDSVIPELVDTFPDAMPIIYMRARLGAPIVSPSAGNFGNSHNSVITDNNPNPPAGVPFREGQYDISQLLPYTSQPIGVGKKVPSYYSNGAGVPTPGPPSHGLKTVKVAPTPAVMGPKGATGYDYPYDAYPYFTNPAIPNTARAKDGFILISAGPDRVYGTNDDITTFGEVAP